MYGFGRGGGLDLGQPRTMPPVALEGVGSGTRIIRNELNRPRSPTMVIGSAGEPEGQGAWIGSQAHVEQGLAEPVDDPKCCTAHGAGCATDLR